MTTKSNFSCTLCGAKFPSEAMARTHIELSNAGEHESQSGFIKSEKYPEGKIITVNPDGSERIIKEEGKSKDDYSINSDELPNGISGVDNVIIRQAVDKAGTDKVNNITKFHEEVVTPALAMEGVIEDEKEVHSYETTRNKLIKHFKLNKTNQSKESEDSKDIINKFENLSGKQKQVLKEYSNGTEDYKELAMSCGVDRAEAVEAVRGNMEIQSAIDDGQFDPESDTADIGTTEVISEKDEESDSSSTEQQSQSIQQDQQQDEQDQEKDGEQENETQRLPYDKDELSSTKQDIVEHMARNPDDSYDEIADAVGCSKSYLSQIQSSNLDTLLERGLQMGNELRDFQITDRRKNTNNVDYSDLTETQKFIISRYKKIKSENNKSEREIVQIISENNTEELTTDGKKFSVEYVAAVIDEFSDLHDSDIETESEKSSATEADGQETQDVEQPDTDERGSQIVARSILSEDAIESEELHDSDIDHLQRLVSISKRMAKKEIERTGDKSTVRVEATLETIEQEIQEISSSEQIDGLRRLVSLKRVVSTHKTMMRREHDKMETEQNLIPVRLQAMLETIEAVMNRTVQRS